MLARKPRGKDHRKKRPPHLHLACQVDPIHDAWKFDIRKDHRDVSPADEHSCERGFSAFTLDRVARRSDLAGTSSYRARWRSEDASRCPTKLAQRPTLMLSIRRKAFCSGEPHDFCGKNAWASFNRPSCWAELAAAPAR